MSGDEITAQHKYGKPFTFRNRDKIICSGNTIPLSEGEDELAYFKRWVIVSFNALFTEEKQDKDLIKKLTTPENLSGLLKLALVGVMLLERDGFEDVPIEVIRDEYNRESQSLKAFVDNRCAIDLSRGDYYTLEDEFYNSYKEYCEKTQTEPPSLNLKRKSYYGVQRVYRKKAQLNLRVMNEE